jgi:hypothetical protein
LLKNTAKVDWDEKEITENQQNQTYIISLINARNLNKLNDLYPEGNQKVISDSLGYPRFYVFEK